jgi:hypothetical protein
MRALDQLQQTRKLCITKLYAFPKGGVGTPKVAKRTLNILVSLRAVSLCLVIIAGGVLPSEILLREQKVQYFISDYQTEQRDNPTVAATLMSLFQLSNCMRGRDSFLKC